MPLPCAHPVLEIPLQYAMIPRPKLPLTLNVKQQMTGLRKEPKLVKLNQGLNRMLKPALQGGMPEPKSKRNCWNFLRHPHRE